MIELNNIIRSNIIALNPYSCARDEYQGMEGIFLDANENPFGEYNRYPDPYQLELKKKLSAFKKIEPEYIFVGNGSDEIIDLSVRMFCNPGIDRVIICPPTYGMYEVSARINDVDVISIPLLDNFQLDVEKILGTPAKMIFLCSPNNPTGNSLTSIERIVENFQGIVFLDEAYIDFSDQPSFVQKVRKYTNLIVTQTFSKAWGKAAIRVGMAYASREMVSYFNKVKPPYNVSQLNQQAAIKTLDESGIIHKNIQTIISQRIWLSNELRALDLVESVFPSDANFLLVKCKDVHRVFQKLLADQIIVRNRHSVINHCLRITVGNQKENFKLIESLKNA